MITEPEHYETFEEPAPAPVVDPLSFIRPRAKRMVSARRTRVIGTLRLALPVGALCVLAALIVWPYIQPSKLAAIAMKNIPDLVIKNLHLTGLDSKNEPYLLMAAKTTRPGGIKNVYDLDQPQGEITLTNGAWIAGNARYGRYDQDMHQLWLGGNVRLYHDKGYQFTTDEAQVDLNDNNAWGSSPVLIQGGFGEIRGQGFRLLDSGKVMVVTGPAHASLDLHGSSASDKPAKTVE
jgi:lipopolysaccharide export system protein LptC